MPLQQTHFGQQQTRGKSGRAHITIAAGAFMVDKLGTGGSAVTTAYVAVPNSSGQTVVTLSFTGVLTRGTQGALTDGYYRLTVDGSKIARAGFSCASEALH